MPGPAITVRFFGRLHVLRKERGLPTVAEVGVPAEGLSGVELAALTDTPLDDVEGLFCNRTVYPLNHHIAPGDRVAFVPKGTPGPHRFFLGLYAAGREDCTE